VLRLRKANFLVETYVDRIYWKMYQNSKAVLSFRVLLVNQQFASLKWLLIQGTPFKINMRDDSEDLRE
jgi:hypothetical protein